MSNEIIIIFFFSFFLFFFQLTVSITSLSFTGWTTAAGVCPRYPVHLFSAFFQPESACTTTALDDESRLSSASLMQLSSICAMLSVIVLSCFLSIRYGYTEIKPR